MTASPEQRRAAILSALCESDGEVSGEQIASALGISRVAVHKHIAALTDVGFVIEARRGGGYRFVAAPDAPAPLVVRPLLASSFYTRIEGGASTGSTNDDARELARGGAPEGTVVLASRQTAGRGRLGRVWASPAGGVYASIVLRPQVETPDAIVLPLVVALGVARGLESLGVPVRIKWPNDVLDERGRKIAGVLLEGLSEGWRVSWVVAGIGVNVRAAPSKADAASVDEALDRRLPLATVTAAVLDGVAEAYGEWRDGGFGALRADYDRRAWLTGRDVTVSDASGGAIVSGRVTGMDAVGRLLVSGARGETAVVTGDVTLRPPARGGRSGGGAADRA